MTGRIVKGIGGFYYVDTKAGLFECRAVGIFRKEGKKPLVGDLVEIEVLSEEEMTGSLVHILPRKNVLLRPSVANVDQVVMVFAAAKPEPNLNLLDRFLVMMEANRVPVILVFNKKDQAEDERILDLKRIYESTGYPLYFISAKDGVGISSVKALLTDQTTVLAGPSGVGKSTLINKIYPDANMQTGSISEKIDRGKHTTRHSELFCLAQNTYIMDTPGFSSLYLEELPAEKVKEYFVEFAEYEPQCRFQGCMHINEPDCGVKDALTKSMICPERYENYRKLYEEVKKMNEKKYR